MSPAAAGSTGQDKDRPWYEALGVEGGGHFRVGGSLSWYQGKDFMRVLGHNPFADAFEELRLKARVSPSNWCRFEVHYENILTGGDTRRLSQGMNLPFTEAVNPSGIGTVRAMSDDSRLMDLTQDIYETDTWIWYQRLDRLNVTLLPDWGVIRLGRQALTWGHGMIFNPLDLFNPFAPTDIYRDYKIGDDMAVMEFPLARSSNLQFLYVARRNPETGQLGFDEASLAGKFHFALGTNEMEFLAAHHYEDVVVGMGSLGYLGAAAWRADVSYTFLGSEAKDQEGFVSLVANLDYSWTWWDKNVYGLVEFYYNGLGERNYWDTLTNPPLAQRLARGELFTLGRIYLAGSIQIELHPLLSLYVSLITNLQDPSGIVQPRAVWGITQNLELTVGTDIIYGGPGSECGGIDIPQSGLVAGPPQQIYGWLTYYF
ncbi:MAG: hypothetical protein K9M96_08305 [Deltaproteobacteria bacterium]|nr:hypothetical protein [Deltaproteobacteria bacterium]